MGRAAALAREIRRDSREAYDMTVYRTDNTATCAGCQQRDLHLWVAIRASYYLTIRLESIRLRQAVLDHITAAWRQHVEHAEEPGGFDEFFDRYCLDVERTPGTQPVDSLDHERRYRQVWSDHARRLHGARSAARGTATPWPR
jgi:hypothetical protein